MISNASSLVTRIDIERMIAVAPEVISACALLLSPRIGVKIYSKVLLASLPPLQRRRRVRRSLISHAKHPTRSKFKGAQKCIRLRFLGVA